MFTRFILPFTIFQVSHVTGPRKSRFGGGAPSPVAESQHSPPETKSDVQAFLFYRSQFLSITCAIKSSVRTLTSAFAISCTDLHCIKLSILIIKPKRKNVCLHTDDFV